jgi:ABC-type Fe3+-citrate transport system substrate-binding protein
MKMKRLIVATLLTGLVSIGVVGCSDSSKSSIKQETKVSTPTGTTTTTTTTEKEVKKTGDKPPAAAP